MAPFQDPVMDGFAATGMALDSSAGNFSLVLDIATAAVVIGVIMELVALILEFREGDLELLSKRVACTHGFGVRVGVMMSSS
jgi:hypothetical protein